MRIKQPPRNSEKRRTTTAANRKGQREHNRFPKSEQRHRSKKASKGLSNRIGATETEVSSTLRRLESDDACYMHKSSHSKPKRSAKKSRLYHKKKTLKDAIERCKQYNSEWRARVFSYAEKLFGKLARKDKARLEALLGLRAYAGPIRASDMAAMRKFGRLCVDVVHSYALALPNLKWFHITLLDDESRISERTPALALKKLKGKAYKEIQELGLNGLLWIDVDALPNYSKGGKGGSFMFHVHALAFTDRDFDVRAARQKLKRSRSWSCSLNAAPTNITAITDRKGTPAWWANYGAKPPYRAKRCIIKPDGTVRLWWTDKGYRPQAAMRLAEGLAQLALMDTLSGVGEGKDLREDIRRRLAAWHRSRWPDQRPIQIRGISKFFKRMWSVTRARRYRKWRIIGATV